MTLGQHLFALSPVVWSTPLMCQRKHPQFIAGYLIDDTVRKFTKKISAPISAKNSANLWGGRDEVNNPFELVHKCARQIGIRADIIVIRRSLKL